MMRTMRSLIVRNLLYQGFADSGATLGASFAAFVLWEHENRPDYQSVGCTSRSAFTLSAHFR